MQGLPLDEQTVTNVYIYVCDSLRYDERPPEVCNRGMTVPTIAQGLCTPPSMASLVTGRYPPNHGIEWFGHTLDDTGRSLFDIEGIESGFTSMWDDAALDAVVGSPPKRTLNDVTEPFLIVEHDHGGHVNYPGYRDISPAHMLRDHLTSDTLREQYRAGIGDSVDRFYERLRELARNDLRDETLVIFTSDHGELLDERGGFVGHRLPACPALMEVPTVFMHPALPTGIVEDGYIRHVDVLPSVSQVLTGEPIAGDGNSVIERSPTTPRSYTHVAVRAPPAWRDTTLLSHFDPLYTGSLIWQGSGGHFINNSGRLRSALTAYCEATETTGSLSAHFQASQPLVDRYQAFHRELKGTTVYREPTMSDATAKAFAASIRQGMTIEPPPPVSESTKATLQALGYR